MAATRKYGPIRVNIRVIFAIILREARVRHGRSRLGYSWAILEPVLLISMLTIIFSTFRARTDLGVDFAVFFATGVLPFQMFRNSSQYIGASYMANRPLFNYQFVRPTDAALARFILETATHLLVITLVLSFQMMVVRAPKPDDIPMMLLALSLLAALALGAGMILSAVRRIYPAVGNVYLVAMGGAFFLSGVIFPLSAVPSYYREILTWNPLVHGIEAFRLGYFAGYRSPDLDLAYLGWWSLTSVFIGLLAVRTVRVND